MTDVVVVGAGVAGLVAARNLARAGRRVTVLEEGAAPGGSVAGHTVDGLRLDAGAESYATRSDVVAQLVAELGLADDVVTPVPEGAWVHLPDGTVPLPRTGVLGIPGRPWAADVRRAVGPVGALRASVDRVLPARVGAHAGDLGSLVRTRMGRRVLDRLVAPVVEGVHAAHPDQVEVLPGLLPGLRRTGSLAGAVAGMRAAAPAGSAVAGLRGGLHRLVEALVADLAALDVEVRTGDAATRLERAGHGWRVHTADGPLGTGRVLLAVPGHVALALLRPVGLGDTDDDVVPVPAPVVLVTLVLDAPELDRAPRGTGVLVATGAPGVTAKALTHVTAKWAWVRDVAGPGRHVVRLSYGRPGDGPPEVDVTTALSDASTLLGVPLEGRLRAHAVTTWATGLPRPRPGHSARIATLRKDLAGTGLAVCGSWAAGTGLVAVVGDARTAAVSLL
ncbi:FAD-dependent oxidoreductase [Cellulomonas sp. APG4]|uniref:protoporphyrinogen/coproporphyrinogen oxidase n=1 Tax=Cellulomonas sp. APG4 TaxID=1538656 RepID=UPI001379C549|nr:FAD-dependent oxidoreductase [Cellulomonas sp. APG4]